MKSTEKRDDTSAGRQRLAASAIAVTILIAAGLAFQFQGQADVIAVVQVEEPSQSLAVPLTQNQPVTYSVSKSPDYCPIGASNAGGESGKSLCSMIWGKVFILRTIADTRAFSWARKLAGEGASKLKPALQFFAGSCFPVLKYILRPPSRDHESREVHAI